MEWAQLLTAAFLAGIVAGFLNPTIGSGNLFTLVVLTSVLGVPVLTAHVANQIAAPASFVASRRRPPPLGGTPAVSFRQALAAMAGVAAGAVALSFVSADWVRDAAPWGVALAAVLLMLSPLAVRHTLRWRAPSLFTAGAYGGLIGSGVRTLVVAALDTGRAGVLAAANTLCLYMSLTVSLSLLTIGGVAAPGLVNWPLALALAGGMFLGGIPATLLVKHLPSSPSGVYWTRASVAIATLTAATYMFTESVRTTVLACAGLGAAASAIALGAMLPRHHEAHGHP